MSRLTLPLSLWAATLCGCATAHLSQGRPDVPAGPGDVRTVVLEPLFESAEWQTSTVTEQAMMTTTPFSTGLNSGATPVTVAREVMMKPFFARVPVLTEVHRRLLAEVQLLRPKWRVTSTGGLLAAEGPVSLVRTLVAGNETVDSDRSLKNMSFAFGLVIWPLLILAAQPVNETEQVTGTLTRFTANAAQLKGQLIRYPSQPDFAVNIVGLTPLTRQFQLDVGYTEGVLADEKPRQQVLIDGLVQRLAAAVVAIVEERP